MARILSTNLLTYNGYNSTDWYNKILSVPQKFDYKIIQQSSNEHRLWDITTRWTRIYETNMTWEDYIPDLPSSYWTSWFIEWIWFPIVDPTTRWIRLDVAYGYQSWPSTFSIYETGKWPTIYYYVSLVIPGIDDISSNTWYAFWLMGDNWVLYLYAVTGPWWNKAARAISYDITSDRVLAHEQDTISTMYQYMSWNNSWWNRYYLFTNWWDWWLSSMWVSSVKELWEEIYNVLSS